MISSSKQILTDTVLGLLIDRNIKYFFVDIFFIIILGPLDNIENIDVFTQLIT